MLVKEAFQITLNDFSVLAFSYLFLIWWIMLNEL